MSSDNSANPLIKDVLKVFDGIDNKHGTRTYYDAHRLTDYSIVSHFKGVGAYSGKLIFTHTNVAASGVYDQQGIYLIGDEIDKKDGVADIDANYETQHSPPWGHPSGVQVCGKYMAMGLQKSVHDNESSVIQIYDVSETAKNKPMKLINTITNRKEKQINGVGMTREKGDEGHYIVMAGSEENLSFYRSKSSSITSEFEPLETKCMDPLHFGGSGFGLITQEDGDLYFIAMHASDGEKSTVNLFKLTFNDDNKVKVKHIGKEIVMKMPGISDPVSNIPVYCSAGIIGGPIGAGISHWVCKEENITEDVLNSSFRWGKGLQIVSSNEIKIYATDRNVLPNPNPMSLDKNLGVVTWKGSADETYIDSDQYDVDWGDGNKYNTGGNLAVALGAHGHCVEMHLGSKSDNSNRLYYKVGEVDFDKKKIKWNDSKKYHTGSDFSIALDTAGSCVQVHRGSSGKKHYYSVGKIIAEEHFEFGHLSHDLKLIKRMIFGPTEGTIDWGDSHQYNTGANLAVALDNHGNCIEVHRGADGSDDENKLYYRLGKIDSKKKTINWKTDNKKYQDSDSDPDLHKAMSGTGNYLDIAIDDEHNCIEVHRGGHGDSNDGHYYRVGKVDFKAGKIDWGDSHRYDTGTTLSIDMDSRGNCVEMHRHSSKDKLYYRVGRINVCSQTIDWGDGSHHIESGTDVSVAMDKEGNVIEVHRHSDDGSDSNKHYDRVGFLK